MLSYVTPDFTALMVLGGYNKKLRPCELVQTAATGCSWELQAPFRIFFFYPLFWMLHSVCNDRSVLWRTETALSMGQQLVFCKSCLLWENMCDHWQPLKVQLEQHNWDCCGIWHALIKRRAHPTVRSLRTAGDGNVKGDNLKMWEKKKKCSLKLLWLKCAFRETTQPTILKSL